MPSINPSPEKAKIAIDTMEKTGSMRQAFVAAGYKMSTAENGMNDKRVVPQFRKQLVLAKERYLKHYIKEAKRSGFTGSFSAKRLKRIADKDGNAKEDQNAIQAIKTHHAIICTGQYSQESLSALHGVFVVPMPFDGSKWEETATNLSRQQRAVTAEIVESKPEKVQNDEKS